MTISSLTRRPDKSARATVGVFLSLVFSVSVFICVHLWFQKAVQGSPRDDQVLTGMVGLRGGRLGPWPRRALGRITNQTGLDRSRRSTIDLLAHAPEVKLVALFSPEHGIRGAADERISSATDAPTGLPVYSLYGDDVRPTDTMLTGLDALVFDIQDAGVRFYTYITTMGYTMEAAAK